MNGSGQRNERHEAHGESESGGGEGGGGEEEAEDRKRDEEAERKACTLAHIALLAKAPDKLAAESTPCGLVEMLLLPHVLGHCMCFSCVSGKGRTSKRT